MRSTSRSRNKGINRCPKNEVSGLESQKLVLGHQPENTAVAFLAKTTDVDGVQLGTALRNKALGMKAVKSIGGGIVTVTFEGI